MPAKKKPKVEEKAPVKRRKQKYEKGILGIKRPKLFFLDEKLGKWPSSSDSDDSEYNPDEATTSKNASAATTKPKPKKRTRKVKVKTTLIGPDDWEMALMQEEPHVLTSYDPWGQNMPRELLTHMFKLATVNYSTVKLLCSVARVCRLWREVSVSATLWQNVDLSYGYVRSTPDTLRWLCDNRLSATTYLNLSGWKCMNDSLLQLVVDSCPALTGINLSYCPKVTAKVIGSLASSERRLTHLALSGAPHTVNKFMSNIIADCGSQLKTLLLDNNDPRCLHGVIGSIADNCSQLQELDISAGTVKFDRQLDVDKLQRGCPQLRVLRMLNCNLTPTNTTADYKTFLGFPELRELNIANISNSTDECLLLQLAGKSPHLRSLDVRNCMYVSWTAIASLPATDLQHLYIARTVTRTTNTPLMTYTLLAKWRHSLVDVDMSWNSLDETALSEAVLNLCDAGEFPRLQSVDLSGTGISIAALKSLLANCPALHTVNLTSCRDLPRGVKHEHAGAAALSSLWRIVLAAAPDQNPERI